MEQQEADEKQVAEKKIWLSRGEKTAIIFFLSFLGLNFLGYMGKLGIVIAFLFFSLWTTYFFLRLFLDKKKVARDPLTMQRTPQQISQLVPFPVVENASIRSDALHVNESNNTMVNPPIVSASFDYPEGKVVVKKRFSYIILLVVSFFILGGFYSFYAASHSFFDDPVKSAPILTSEQCDGALYIARNWCPSNVMQKCGPRQILIQKVNISLMEKIFGSEFILNHSNSVLDSRTHIFDNHWIESSFKPHVLWDNTQDSAVSDLYFRSEPRSLTANEVACLQKVMPNIRSKVRESSDAAINTSFQSGVGIVWEMSKGYFGFDAFSPSSGRRSVIDLSMDSKRKKAIGAVIEHFSFTDRGALVMSVPYYTKSEQRYSSDTTQIVFDVSLDKKSIAVPDLINYSQKIREDSTTAEFQYSIMDASISYEEIVAAMEEAKFENGKSVRDLLEIKRVSPVTFGSTAVKLVIDKPSL